MPRFIRPLFSSRPQQTDGLDGLMRGEGDALISRAERESAWRETLMAAVEGDCTARKGFEDILAEANLEERICRRPSGTLLAPAYCPSACPFFNRLAWTGNPRRLKGVPMEIRSVTKAVGPMDAFHFGSSVAPGEDFFSEFSARFDAWQEEACHPLGSVDRVLGVTHSEFQNRRWTDAIEREGYAQILGEAYSTGGMHDPLAFLKGLSDWEIGVIQRAHSLADGIDTEAITQEGAYNLLLPEGYSVDLNRDGISEVGVARMIVFPPLDAPELFRAAWRDVTDGMSEGDVLTYQLTLWGAFHPMKDGTIRTAHGLPSDDVGSYRDVLERLLEANEWFRGLLAEGQYERDRLVYTELLQHLDSALG